MISRIWSWWADLWDGEEAPWSLALLRIGLGLCLLGDFGYIGISGLVIPLFAPQEAGGWADAMQRGDNVALLYQWFEPTATTAMGLYVVLMLSALSMTVGLFSRTSAAVLLACYAQHAQIIPHADRGIDMLCRNLLMILMFSGSGAAFSLDALLRGDWRGREARIASWPRRLIVLQLVVMYFTAGVQKVGVLWLPMGGFTALYVILQDPAIAKFDFAWLIHEPFLLSTRFSTAITVLWQSAYPLVLLWMYYRATPDQPGRLRAFSNRWHLHLVWVFVGAVFHLLLAASMELGIFPWAMLAAYPAFIHPTELRGLWENYLRRRPPQVPSA